MKVLRRIIQIDEELCDGCGNCIPSCAEGALQIVDGKARVVGDKFCDGLGACLGECPNGALSVVEREAEEFDEAAVVAYLEKREKGAEIKIGACPSAQMESFGPAPGPPAVSEPVRMDVGESTLGHWPVQIRLIPAEAPFLKGADLLVLADCVPVAFPGLHETFLKGKAVMLGCPKFDEVQAYIDKFADIFRTAGIKSVTVAVMEVPCCSALPQIVKRGMEAAGVTIPLKEIVISRRGKILSRKEMLAA